MKKRIIIAGVSITLGLIIVLCVALMFAKYKINLGEQSEITSQNFYFSSNFLKSDEVPTYEIYGNTVTFEVRNYIDSLRINATNTNINYIVNTDPADDGSLKKSGEEKDCKGKELTLTGGAKNSDSITLTYNFPDNEDQKEITVTAESTDVYKKVLKAKFKLLKPDGIAYEIKDRVGRDYAELYIYTGNTGNTESNVTINWNNDKILIDETNDYVFGKLDSNKNPVVTVNIAAYTTVKIVFFKNNITDNYNCDITKSNGTITIP